MHHKDFNYKKLGELEVSGIANKIRNLNLDWDEYTYRQTRYKDHSKTKTIPLIWSENFDGIQEWKTLEKFSDDLFPIFSFLKDLLGDGEIVSAILINLPAEESIGRHRDANPKGNRFNLCHRIHIPIITNKECFFEIEREELNMCEGEVWEISNVRKLHSVRNLGEIDRIHLLIDFVPRNVFEIYFKS
jgi:hypothetical protein